MSDNSPTAEFVAALASAMGGELVPPDVERHDRLPSIRFSSPRCLLRLSSAWRARGKWHAWVYDDKGQTVSAAQSANFSPSRSVVEVAADLRRRVLEASRAALVAHYTAGAVRAAEAQDIAGKVERLEQVAGCKNDAQRYGRGAFIRLPGFEVERDYYFGSRHSNCYSATVTVHSFECLLMIARLVAEDQRINSKKPS